MSDILLYQMPGSCSRIALNALEEIGLPYREKSVSLMTGEQASPAFRAINPKGKVPVLICDGVTITELPVILYHLANNHPDARLLPAGPDGRADLVGLSDLIWVAGALHPLANRIFRPSAVSQLDVAGVKAGAIAQLAVQAQAISDRLGAQPWWYGPRWSITDAFIAWVFAIAASVGFPIDTYQPVVAHIGRVQDRPSFRQARAREQAAIARDGLAMPPGMTL